VVGLDGAGRLMCAACERRPCVIGEGGAPENAHVDPLMRDILAAWARPVGAVPVEPRCTRCGDRQATARICARCHRELDAMGRDLARGDA
jgi:hypothetical protein